MILTLLYGFVIDVIFLCLTVGIECRFHKYQWNEEFKTDGHNDFRCLVDKDIETSAPLSLISNISREEDIYTGAQAVPPFSPRKQVLLGPNHQANIPLLGRHIKKDIFVQNGASDTNDINYEEIMMGTCIIPMPDLDISANNSGNIGAGRTDCGCLDRGSFRCVQQHVMVARENPRKSLGHEKFARQGFYDMGEDVAHKWSEDEEIFREKRAVQNRSSVLEIVSDDDEWHGSQQAYVVEASEKDEDSSAIESLADQEVTLIVIAVMVNYSNATEREDYGVNLLLKGHVSKPFGESKFNAVFERTNEVSEQVEDLDVQDDSCMSFVFQPNMVDSHSLIDTKGWLTR
ncbi:putative C2H2-like zinc finger protein [Hibiscus syriacus]|uniref:C2H2-like zinc finger protein n=1 Tax=Hibiscus syriacus TaxID=106335 RepID=A0A6A3CS57_HIBSY|nr:putative C2H2-like zinc finger protein [Hibiscus syriacus]